MAVSPRLWLFSHLSDVQVSLSSVLDVSQKELCAFDMSTGGWQGRRLPCHHFGLELQGIYFNVFSTSPEAKAGNRQDRLVGPHLPGVLGQRAFSEKGFIF